MVKRLNFLCEQFAIELNHKQTLERVAFSVYGGMLTLPRQYFGVTGIASNTSPMQIWNQWWEFLASGPGVQTRVYNLAEDLGDGWVTFKDLSEVDAGGCYLKVISDTTEDTTEKMLLKGTDENGELLRSGTGGEQMYGEEIDVSETANWTAAKFKSLSQIRKPKTNGRVRIFASATSGDSNPTAVAIMEPDETDPCLRRYRVPRSDDAATATSVEAICQLRTIWLEDQDSIVPVGNLSALRDGLLALHYKDQNDEIRYEKLMGEALRILRAEHKRFHPMSSFPASIHFDEGHPSEQIY